MNDSPDMWLISDPLSCEQTVVLLLFAAVCKSSGIARDKAASELLRVIMAMN